MQIEKNVNMPIDHKDYVATLYYYADNEMNNKDLEYTRAIVEWTKETLTKLDFDYLDNQEKYQPGCKCSFSIL